MHDMRCSEIDMSCIGLPESSINDFFPKKKILRREIRFPLSLIVLFIIAAIAVSQRAKHNLIGYRLLIYPSGLVWHIPPKTSVMIPKSHKNIN